MCLYATWEGKANIVADALSRRSMGSIAHVEAEKRQLTREIHHLACLGVQLVNSNDGGGVLQNTAKSSLVAEVKERKYKDPELVELRERVLQQKKSLLELNGDGILRYRGRLCVPDVAGLRNKIMSEIKVRRGEFDLVIGKIVIRSIKENMGRGLKSISAKTAHWITMNPNIIEIGPRGKPFMVKEPYECFDLIGDLQFPDPNVAIVILFHLLRGYVGKKGIG
ncbi:uncharacterized protein [Nicotiana tomentosiformis]|uniref:uncharacterized protein n=1 Tax=Nicotiana tomentosiformis TaxID=4098 RepID=UPI00388CDC7E